MLCGKCGCVLPNDQSVCPSCGAVLSLSSVRTLQSTGGSVPDTVRGGSAIQKREDDGRRIQKINPTVYVAPELQGNLRKAERSRGIGIAALFFSIFFPPLGLLLGAIASAKADKGLKFSNSAKCRAGRILGLTSIAVSIITTYGVIALIYDFFSCVAGCTFY